MVKWLFLLLWPIASFAQQVTVTWDKPPVSYPTWYVVCASQTVNSPCIPFTYFPGISGFSVATNYSFDESQLRLPLGSNYCIRIAAIKSGSWPWGDWTYPLCTTYSQ